MAVSMKPEQTRQERFIGYAQILRERFTSGLLSQLQPLRQWVVWKPEQEARGNIHKVPYNPGHHFKASSKSLRPGEHLRLRKRKIVRC